MIPPTLILYAVIAVVLLGIGAAGGCQFQAGRVRAAQDEASATALQRDAARQGVSDRDTVIGIQQKAAEVMAKSLDRQHVAIAECVAASAGRAKRGDSAIAEARRYVDDTRAEIAALAARMQAGAALSCEQAAAEVRRELAP